MLPPQRQGLRPPPTALIGPHMASFNHCCAALNEYCVRNVTELAPAEQSSALCCASLGQPACVVVSLDCPGSQVPPLPTRPAHPPSPPAQPTRPPSQHECRLWIRPQRVPGALDCAVTHVQPPRHQRHPHVQQAVLQHHAAVGALQQAGSMAEAGPAAAAAASAARGRNPSGIARQLCAAHALASTQVLGMQHPPPTGNTHLEVLDANIAPLQHLAVPQLHKVAPGPVLNQEEHALVNLRGMSRGGSGG